MEENTANFYLLNLKSYNVVLECILNKLKVHLTSYRINNNLCKHTTYIFLKSFKTN